ncbi:hypothetical protein TcWFU_003162 [Taenia crassiceps]|uniref:Uncharacterized protein n=1 Tax=Taenia crassiceps TaxID=6207 RepID=A0ABR4QGH8_9CEST
MVSWDETVAVASLPTLDLPVCIMDASWELEFDSFAISETRPSDEEVALADPLKWSRKKGTQNYLRHSRDALGHHPSTKDDTPMLSTSGDEDKENVNPSIRSVRLLERRNSGFHVNNPR